jgi:signal transduction histidine kinase
LAIASTPATLTDPLRLRRRLGLQGAAFGLLLLAVFSAAVYWGMAAERRENLRAEARQLAASAAAQLPLISHEVQEIGNARKFRNDREVVALQGRRHQRVQWFSAGGQLLLEEGQLALPPLQATLWQQWPGGLSLRQPVYTRVRSAVGPASSPQLSGFVRVGLTTVPLEQELARLRRGLLLGGICAVIVTLMVGRGLLRQAFLPLQRQVEALERFSADVSHELRHPLTLARTLLASQPVPLPPLLARLDGIAAGMAALLDDLLFLARQDSAPVPGVALRWRRFDLLELLEDQLENCRPIAAAATVDLQLEAGVAVELPVRGQPEQLARLFTNLLANAIRFSPPGAQVRLQPRRAAGRLLVAVIDQGPGIAPAHRQAVFERFWRLDCGAEASHSGLGLPIARAIARCHGGELTLAEADPGRCVLLVDLPAA